MMILGGLNLTHTRKSDSFVTLSPAGDATEFKSAIKPLEFYFNRSFNHTISQSDSKLFKSNFSRGLGATSNIPPRSSEPMVKYFYDANESYMTYLVQLLKEMTSNVFIMVGFILNNEVLLREMVVAANRGVRQVVLINYLPDGNDPNNANLFNLINELAGNENVVFRYCGNLHAKVAVFGRSHVAMGSSNFTKAGLSKRNVEFNVIINNPDACDQVNLWASMLLRHSRAYR